MDISASSVQRAERIFLRGLFDGGEHGAFVFFRTIGLGKRVETLGIRFGIGDVQRREQHGSGLGMLAAFGSADHGALAGGIGGVLQHGGEFFVFGASFSPFVSVVESLSALILNSAVA